MDIITYALCKKYCDEHSVTLTDEQVAQALEDYLSKNPGTIITEETIGTYLDAITAEDVGALPNTTKIPSKTSDLTNDSGYVNLNDIQEYSNKVEDVQVNGTSVVQNKIANIILSDTIIGKDFITDITVGHLEAGTTISSTDKIGDILYKILCKEEE